MAQAVPAIMLITTLATTAYSISKQNEAKSEAEAIAKKNAKRIEDETREAAKRARKNADRVESQARAKAAASGVGGASADAYIRELEETNEDQIAWLKKSGASRAAIAKRGGAVESARADAAMVGTLAQGAQTSYNIGANTGWW